MSRQPPGWVVAPAAALRDLMREQDLTVPMLSSAVAEERRDEVAQLIQDVLGREPVRVVHAAALAAATGIMPGFWLELERAYRDGLGDGYVDVALAPALLGLPSGGPPWCSGCLAGIADPGQDHKPDCGRLGQPGNFHPARW